MGEVIRFEYAIDSFLAGMANTVERECMSYGYMPTRLQGSKTVRLVLPGLHAKTQYAITTGISRNLKEFTLKTTLVVPFSQTCRSWDEGGRIAGAGTGTFLRASKQRFVFEATVQTSLDTYCLDVKRELDRVSPKALKITEYLQNVGLLRTYDLPFEEEINPVC